ncbi:MAG: DNA-binding XRE family transcriptional regulator [Phenylobacterium sp.]|jgi:DNA-binding XRE family transcriptional regulator
MQRAETKNMMEISIGQVYIPHEVVGIQLMQQCSLITAWRKHKKLTQSDLAVKADITQAALSQIESAQSKPQQRTLQKVADALGLNIE